MSELLTRARTAARSAHLLLGAGDWRGAVDRAYYAMFDLAKHALREVDPKLAVARKHTTIIARFSKHVVQEKGYPRDLGRALRRVFDARLVADYSDAATTREQATEVVEAMERFFAFIAGNGGTDPK